MTTIPFNFCRCLVGRLSAIALLIALAAPSLAGDSAANLFCDGIRVQDEIVVVNVRNVCGCCDPATLREKVTFETYALTGDSGEREWQPSSLENFVAFNPDVPTVIFVHGNQITSCDAKCDGLAVYRRLALHADANRPLRFVVFSWPSAKVGGLLNDVRVKAARTGPAGCQLAWLVDQMPAETPISYLGFSFGARIITGGLHILGGGSLGGACHLGERAHPNRQPMNAFLIASALHAHWLAEGCYHGLAMTQVSRMCLINNCADPAMKYYHLLEPGLGGPQALGYCGPTCIGSDYASKIVLCDVSRCVGGQHDLMRYVCCSGSTGLMWQYTAGAAEQAK
ncbi:MAG: hypothetical protein IT425_10830 [Pirellulales bacterium]|nr:hypothetical protein [Pirellulales bacterium]